MSATKVYKRLLNTIDWSSKDVHCQIDAERMARLSHFHSMVEPVRCHHKRWEDSVQPNVPEKAKMRTKLIYLLDCVNPISGHVQGESRATGKEAW